MPLVPPLIRGEGGEGRGEGRGEGGGRGEGRGGRREGGGGKDYPY